jgi:hypothetical protein
MRRARLLLWVSLLVTSVGSASFAWDDIATFFGDQSTPFQLCFGVQSVQDSAAISGYPTWAQVVRTRQEDNTPETLAFPRTAWTVSATLPQGNLYCTPDALTRSGHFVYQLRLCPAMPPAPTVTASCSAWVSSTDPTVATLNGNPRAWWVYGFLYPQAPAGVTFATFTARR